MKVTSDVRAGGIHINHSQAVKGLRVESKLKAGALAFLLLLSLAQVVTISAQQGREGEEAQARREREIQACMRPAEVAYRKAVDDARQAERLAESKAEDDYRVATRNAKSDAARTAAKRAQREALREAEAEFRGAVRGAQAARQQAFESCRNAAASRDGE